MKPKLAIVARKVPPLYGGGGMLARSLAIGLDNMGYEVDLLTDTPSPNSIDNCNVLSPYKSEQSTHPVKRLLRRWTEYRWLKRHIIKNNYDIVYGVSAQAFTLSAVHIAKHLGIPTSFETSLFGNDDYLTICNQRLGPVLKHFFLSADKIVNISPPLEKSCIDGSIDRAKLEMIPNPVNELAFYPIEIHVKANLRKKLGIAETAKILFSAGAISHRKGHDRLISAFIQIAKHDVDCILALAGPKANDNSTQTFIKNLKSSLNKANLNNRVIWLGQIENVNEWMQASDIFIFASRREGFGTVFTEAMSVGLPIVAYNIDGITDYIFKKSSKANIVKTETQFINSVLSLTKSEKKRNVEGALLRKYYEKNFSSSVIFNQYHNLFSMLQDNRY